MGKIVSVLSKRAIKKPVMDYNLEQRAFKEISREKRPAAPRHESTAALIEESVRAQSAEIKRNLEVKDDLLMERLRDVYVTSQDIMPKQQIKSSSSRPLPTDRTVHVDPEYGYFEPKKVPYGKITLRDAVQAISKHQENPDMWTAHRLSREYRLDLGLTEKIIQHFRTFVLIIPETSKDKDKVNLSAVKTIPFIAPENLKQLPGFTKAKDKEEVNSNLAKS